MKFKKICIIGCGLIGSSIARAIKKNKVSKKIVSVNRSKKTNNTIKKLKLVDEASSDLKEMITDSDLVIIAIPLGSYRKLIFKIKNFINDGAILTDVGSVKKNVINLIEKNISKKNSWISSHPIAGTEESGPKAGRADLFVNRWCILTPSKKSKKKDINKLKIFWKKIGCKVDIMSQVKHDKILSITSHLPHLIAYNLVKTSLNIQAKEKFQIIKYSAGGLRDFTRIAASNPIMWKDIFLFNKINTIKNIDKFILNLKFFKKNIKNNNEKNLINIFTQTKKIRKQIIKFGQDINKPNFGRK